MIDTHCHLTYEPLANQVDAVVHRAAVAGVSRLITIGTDLADSRKAIELAARFENVRCSVGIHPNHADRAAAEDFDEIERLAKHDRALAIGETGLDHFHKDVPLEIQLRAFEEQLDLAIRLNKPVVIHSRQSAADTLDVMSRFGGVRAIFHCFTGTFDEAKRILDRGFLLGFTGPVTYKKNDELRRIARECPADRIVVETDSPYLSPEPVRSIRPCEPAFIMHTARTIAAERGLTIDEFDQLTTQNAARFFGWPD